MISNCSIDENGKAYGGKAGDNNGKEWYLRSWYSSPWKFVLRYPDEKVRNKIAELARQAAQNNMVGYDQHNRLSFWKELEKVGYEPKNIKTACEADCSSGVMAIIKATGHLMGIEALKIIRHGCYTGNMRQELIEAGFQVLTEKKYLTSDKYLLKGDILLREYGHTATNLTDGSAANSNTVSSIGGTHPTVKDFQLAAVADGFKLNVDGIWGNETNRVAKQAIVKQRLVYQYPNLTKLVQKFLGVKQDGKCGKDTTAAIKEYQQSVHLLADGKCGLNTWRSILNIK